MESVKLLCVELDGMLLKGTGIFSLLKLGNNWPLDPQRAQSALSLKKACDMNPKINT